LAWRLAFGIWSTTWEAHSGVTPLLINSNLDLNAYIRRFAGSLTENLHFDGVEACIYTSGSSKKLSSLLLALTVAPFPNPVQGITAFQGALAGAVLLVVFQDWLLQPFRDNGHSGAIARLLAAAWVMTSPMPYWLAANNYLSQALFLILASIGYREMRRHQLGLRSYPKSVWRLLLAALTIATYSFYPPLLPLLILALLLTQVVYGFAMAEPWRCLLRQGVLTTLVSGLAVLLLLTFTDHELGGVSRMLNPMIAHASNFVPINPWSLLQEAPSPIPSGARDSNWWFHLSLGLLVSLLGGLLCWRFWRRRAQPDLFAAVMGMAAYGGHLLLFFPLESTYRLMKGNTIMLYPLAVCGAVPLVLALRRWTIKQGPSTRLVFSLLAVFHIRLPRVRRDKPGHLAWGHRLRTNNHPAPGSRRSDCGLFLREGFHREGFHRAIEPPISRALGGSGFGLASPGAGHSRLHQLPWFHDRRTLSTRPPRHPGRPIQWSDH